MAEAQSTLMIKRPINVKVIVTPRWKEEAQAQLQNQINGLDGQLQQLDLQGQKAIATIQQQKPAQMTQQIEGVQGQVNQKKTELLEQKNRFLQQLQQVQGLELDQEVSQGQMESFCSIGVGDNLVRKMGVEILVRDGVIEEIRGEV